MVIKGWLLCAKAIRSRRWKASLNRVGGDNLQFCCGAATDRLEAVREDVGDSGSRRRFAIIYIAACARFIWAMGLLHNSGVPQSRQSYAEGPSSAAQTPREARIYSAWRAITWFGWSAALVFLQISRYLLQKPPCSPSQFERRASTRINLRFPRSLGGRRRRSEKWPQRG